MPFDFSHVSASPKPRVRRRCLTCGTPFLRVQRDIWICDECKESEPWDETPDWLNGATGRTSRSTRELRRLREAERRS